MACKVNDDLRDVMRDFFYPIGALFISKNNTNPNSIMGGTWVAVTNDYLLNFITSGTGGSYDGNSNSATDSTVLSPAQMPSHTHIQNAHTHALWMVFGNSGGGYPNKYAAPWSPNGSHSLGAVNGYGSTEGETPWGIQTVTASNQYTGGSGGHNHGLNLKKLNMYGWLRTA